MKLLYITSLSGKRINGFMRSAIVAAKQLGISFTMACNTDMADKSDYAEDCKRYDIQLKHVDFDRNPLGRKNSRAKRQLLEIIKEGNYDIVHCNTPVGGLIGRSCAHKCKVKTIIYQAHGFHFWKGAPLKNWLIYYPVEKYMSKYTDVLVTIAKDDYELAKRLNAKRISYVHGVGVDFNRFSKKRSDDRNSVLRKELGIPDEASVVLSVGELNRNKNHKTVIDAMAELGHQIYYVICGDGELREEYSQYIMNEDLSDRVRIMGYRSDISEFYRMADLFVFPSLREGIPGAIMEAISTGIPVIASDIRGVRDIVPDKKYRFSPADSKEISKLIEETLAKDNSENIDLNFMNLRPYGFDNVVKELKEIYQSTFSK